MVMERNFVTENGSAERPRRTWRKNTGPGELSLTPTATARKSGDITRSTTELMHRLECPLHELVPTRGQVGLGDLEE